MRVLRIAHASLTPTLRERERALARRYPDIDLELITTERWREAEVEVFAAEDDLFPVTKARARLSKHVQLFAYNPGPVIAALRRHRPHLVDLNGEPYSLACAEILTLCNWFAPKAAVVLQTCQNIFHRYPPPFNWLERRALKRIDAAYPCSETARELLRVKGFGKLAPIVPFGVDAKAFTPRPPASGTPNGPLTIGFVGRMLPGKGANVLAEALVRLAAENWKLLVIGDGPQRSMFEAILAKHELGGQARFTGAVSYDTVPQFYQQMDVLVVPTQTTKRIREQFGRVIIEAMASGVPVIGSTCGAIPEVIGDAGLIVSEGDAGALADVLRRLLHDAALRDRLARAGRERIEEHYTWDRVADRTYDLFCHILRNRATETRRQEMGLAANSRGGWLRDEVENVGR